MLFFPRWKSFLVVALVALGFFFFLPNVVSVPWGAPGLRFGLDLKGGSQVFLGVDGGALVRDRLALPWEEARAALRGLGISYTTEPPRIDPESGRALFTFTVRSKHQEKRALEAIRERVSSYEGGALRVDKSAADVTVYMSARDLSQQMHQAGVQSLEILRRRVDALGTRESVIQMYGRDRILIEVPGLDDPGELVSLLGRMAKLNFHLVDVRANPSGRDLPEGDEVLYMNSAGGKRIPVVVRKRAALDGSLLADARAGFDQDRKPCVFLHFNATGSRLFGDISRRHIGQPLAIVLDGEVISAPILTSVILSGAAQISGHFSLEEAEKLALLLRAGALPAPLNVLEQHTVGASLGADSVRGGVISALVGLSLVATFMTVAYGVFGLLANISLFINLVLILGVLSLLQATLTLPGIAGIVLTLGMAVDANVLVFERMREEATRGRHTPLGCIESGYAKAFSSILDSNLTTLIAAVILFVLGSGPVRGFSITLGIGVLTSFFTSYTLNRLLVATWFHVKRPKLLPL